METRTAPQWIRDTEERYRRAGRLWGAARYLWLPFLAAWLAIIRIPSVAARTYLGCAILLGWAGLVILEPGKRARRCGVASGALQAAIAAYEGNPDQPDSALAEADQRVREALRTERVRTAPPWIVHKLFRCRLKIFAWMSPVAIAIMALPAVAVSWRWNWERPWSIAFCVAAVVFLLLVSAGHKTRRLMKARDILTEAIERYEFESAATGNTLRAADRQASGVLPD